MKKKGGGGVDTNITLFHHDFYYFPDTFINSIYEIEPSFPISPIPYNNLHLIDFNRNA